MYQFKIKQIVLIMFSTVLFFLPFQTLLATGDSDIASVGFTDYQILGQMYDKVDPQLVPRIQAIEEYMTQAWQELKSPGAALALVYNGEIVYTGAWGVTGGEREPITAQTPFLIGSNSKALTSYGIMLLVQKGLIDLKEPVQTYLPWFTLADNAAAQITVEQLMLQTSGLSTAVGLRLSDLGANDDKAIERMVQNLSIEHLTSVPGERHQYSNANFVILGALIESVTGVPFAEFIEREVFQPLGMQQAAANTQQAVEKGLQPGYRSWLGFSVESRVPYDTGGAPYGYMAASAEDLAHYIRALMEPGAILSPELTAQMFEPQVQTNTVSSYGYGWRITPLEDGQLKVWHSGSTPDHHSHVFMLPERGFGLVLLTNRNNTVEELRMGAVTKGLTDILLEEDPEIPVFSPAPERLGAAGLFVLLFVVFVFLISKVLRRKATPRKRWLWITLALVFFILGGVLIPLFVTLIGVPWRSIALFAPDIAFLVGAITVILLLNGVTSIWMAKNLKHKHNELS